MDILVIDVPDAWGMLLSRKWGATLGESIQMDLSYATIPFSENTFVKLHREKERKFHVEDPNEPMNEFIRQMGELGNYVICSITSNDKFNDQKIEQTCKRSFDEVYYRTRKETQSIVASPNSKSNHFAFRLWMDALERQNNLADKTVISISALPSFEELSDS